jgi:dephospho-CoA kinase
MIQCRKVGLTGGIACGKTQVSTFFAAYGVPVADADQIARQLTEPQQPGWMDIHAVFGDEMFNNDQSLNRTKLRERIFADESARRRLEAIMHPKIRNIMEIWATTLNTVYCILSIPLLTETRQTAWMDRVLVTDCESGIQYRRLKTRDRLDAKNTARILNAQCQREQRLKYADDVIYNNGSLVELEKQVRDLHQFYTSWALKAG